MLNLTQHPASQEQINLGVVEPTNKQEVKDLLTFGEEITEMHESEFVADMVKRCKRLVEIVKEHGETAVMLGGAGYLMEPLQVALRANGINAYHAYSVRQSVESVNAAGETVKTNVFVHKSFLKAVDYNGMF